MSWIKHPITLTGKRVRLSPLETDHFEEICLLGKEKTIWTYSPMDVDGSDSENMIASLQKKMEMRDKGEYYPFVILLNETNEIAGLTMYWNISEQNRSVEIGSTWLHPHYWSTGINTECKYLMLQFCFEVLGTMRVQLKSLDKNIRSRKAIEKLGAKFEGILRKDKILEDGSVRNAAYYSILDDEWESVKINLQQLLTTGS